MLLSNLRLRSSHFLIIRTHFDLRLSQPAGDRTSVEMSLERLRIPGASIPRAGGYRLRRCENPVGAIIVLLGATVFAGGSNGFSEGRRFKSGIILCCSPSSEARLGVAHPNMLTRINEL